MGDYRRAFVLGLLRFGTSLAWAFILGRPFRRMWGTRPAFPGRRQPWSISVARFGVLWRLSSRPSSILGMGAHI